MNSASQVRLERDIAIVPVRVDGIEIEEVAIAREMQHHPAESLDEARRLATQALVVRELLVQEARRQGLGDDDDMAGDGSVDDPRIAALIEKEVRCPEPDETTCRRYFDNNPAQFESPELYEARHILLASPPDDAEARGAGKILAGELIGILQAEPDRFGELAKLHSACPSGQQEGRLGMLSRGDTVPEFETFLFSLSTGELCPVPIETRYGVHIIQLDRKVSAIAPAFEDIKEQIAEFLRTRSLHTALRQYILLLVGQATIEGVEMEAAHSPLVQ